MIYVDEAIWRRYGLKWCHLLADDVDELHRFAARLGIWRSSYQGPPKTSAPHYDLTGYERARAIALGARPCSRDEIVAVFRAVRVAGGKRHASYVSPLWPLVARGRGSKDDVACIASPHDPSPHDPPP